MNLLKPLLEEIRRLKMTDIRLYDSRGHSIFADHFLIATAASVIQMEAARNSLVDLMKKNHVRLRNPMENFRGGWCLLDFGNIIVHLFLEETRQFYGLDSLFESRRFDLDSIRDAAAKKKTKTKKTVSGGKSPAKRKKPPARKAKKASGTAPKRKAAIKTGKSRKSPGNKSARKTVKARKKPTR